MTVHAETHAVTSNKLTVIHEEIPYIATLSLVRSADEVVKIPHDFVNRYIIQLAEHAGMSII